MSISTAVHSSHFNVAHDSQKYKSEIGRRKKHEHCANMDIRAASFFKRSLYASYDVSAMV
jgi:hypothetical protein